MRSEILVACRQAWLMFKLINNSVCGRNCSTRRLQSVGDKMTCGTYGDAILNTEESMNYWHQTLPKRNLHQLIFTAIDLAVTCFITTMMPLFVNSFRRMTLLYFELFIFHLTKEHFNAL